MLEIFTEILLSALTFAALYFFITLPLKIIARGRHPALKSAIKSLKLPLATLLILLFLIHTAYYIAGIYDFALPISLKVVRGFTFITMITWFFFCWKGSFIESLPNKRDPFVLGANFFLSLLILFLALLFILDLLNIPIAALLTFGGIGGLAVSFAAKDLLSNLFGSIMMHFNGHITVGDFIRSTSKSFEGHVEKISWFHTRLRSLDKTILYVPNSTITESIIENEGKRSHRRLVANIPVRYLDADKVTKLTKEIDAYLKHNPAVDTKEDISIALHSYGPYAMELTLYTYLKEINFVLFNKEQQKILLAINDIIKAQDADFGLQTSLSLNKP